MALGGSTNAVIHLLALAGRTAVPLTLERFDQLSRRTPILVNFRPSGEYLVAQLFHAGRVQAVLKELAPLLHEDALTVSGETLVEGYAEVGGLDRRVIATLGAPFGAQGGIAIVRGSLAPDGAVVKRSAASSELLRHRGPAVVFEDIDDLAARIDDPALDVDPGSVLVLRHAGPEGSTGHA